MSAPAALRAALLAGDVVPGVYRWDVAQAGGDVAEVRREVEAAGWRFAHLDAGGGTRTAVLTALGEALALPSWWGRNLDALADCLADLDPHPTVLLWDGWGGFAGADPRAFAVVRRLLAGAGLVVLLRGEGPDGDVPPLDRATS